MYRLKRHTLQYVEKWVNYSLRHYTIKLCSIEYKAESLTYEFSFERRGVWASMGILADTLKETTIDAIARHAAEFYGIKDYPYDIHAPLIREQLKKTVKSKLRRKIRV